jgi:biopolymer transport protein ExbD
VAKLRKRKKEAGPAMQIAPMIDVVFLMLIYFMVSSTLERQEADVSFRLPATVQQASSLEMPDEQIIEIDADGRVIVNDHVYDQPGAGRLVELTAMLARFRQTSEASRVDAAVTLAPAGEAPHQMVVRVLDACSAAGIEAIRFALEEEF